MCGKEANEALDPVFFKALSDPNRVALVDRLCGCCSSITVTQVSECCNVDMSVVSRHLKILLQAGIVTAEKQGREVRYTLVPGAIVGKLRGMADAVERECRTGVCGTSTPEQK